MQSEIDMNRQKLAAEVAQIELDAMRAQAETTRPKTEEA